MSVTDTNHVTRQESQRLAAEEAGITWPATILPEGTALYSSGVEKLKSDRASWRRLPLASEVVGLVESALEAESRMDLPVNVNDVQLHPVTGRLLPFRTFPDTQAMGYDEHSFRQLLAQVDPLDNAPRGFASAMLFLRDDERAQILNERISVANPETSIVLRTKLPHEGNSRIVRAALSERYGSVTDQDIAKTLGILLKEWNDGSGRLDYKPGDQRSRFEIIWPSEVPVETFKVGDIHYATLSIGNSDTGEGSLRVSSGLLRAACANLTLSRGDGMEISIRHIGKSENLIQKLAASIRLQLDTLQPLIDEITMAAKIKIDLTWSPEKALGALGKKYELTKAVQENTVKMLTEGNRGAGYPFTVWGLASALTEAAHKTETWRDEADIERIAANFQSRAVEIAKAGPAVDLIAKVVTG